MAFVLVFTMIMPSALVSGAGGATSAESVPLRNGLKGEYYTVNSSSPYAFNTYKATYLDQQINFPNMETVLAERAGQSDYAGTIWTGKIIPKESGSYVFSSYSDNGFRLYVGNDTTPIISWWVNDWDKEQYAPAMNLVAGQEYTFKMEYMELNGGSHVYLYWNKDNQGKTLVPADVFYLRDDFRPAVITNVDLTGANLFEGQISGNAVITVADLTDTTTIGIVNAGGAAVLGFENLPILNKTADKVTVKIPESIKMGGYKFVAKDNGIKSLSKDLFVILSENVRGEYPRPDWERSDKWLNLNGAWDFKFDPSKVGETSQWYKQDIKDLTIIVPFPWESPASGVVAPDYKGTAWYQRNLELDSSWSGKRIVIKFGAVDWKSTLYVNGQKVGDQVGGYTPFEFDITNYVNIGQNNKITLMVNDEGNYGDNSYTALVGKQGHNAPCGYTHTSGIWQTVILEGRYSDTQIGYAHIDPLVDSSSAKFNMNIVSATEGTKNLTIKYNFKSTLWDNKAGVNNDTGSTFSGETPVTVTAKGDNLSDFTVSISNQKLWWPDECNLYEGTLELYNGTVLLDRVKTYFGQRKLSRQIYHSGKDYEYIYLNNKPVFLSGLLDQGFWEEGIYTAPSADALKFDVESMRSVGFNLIRKHLKIEDPIQYYWCDKLGMMVWEDMPHATNMNLVSGQNGSGRAVYQSALESMINRDYNHPSTIAYILFNETWGITHNTNTDNWIREMYNFTKAKDTSGRFAEDMSPCNNDHIQPTDMNTFHMYPTGYPETKSAVDNRDAGTYVGSRNNFNSNGVTGGNAQDGDPWLNSEYGGVGAYDGDHDVSWCFKYQTDIQRLRQKLCGFVYTEPYDIEYECNGILNYNRTWKIFGYEEIAYGGDMGIKQLTQADYVGIDKEPVVTVAPGGTYSATVGMIRWSDYAISNPVLKWRFDGTDLYGNKITTDIKGQTNITYAPYTYETKNISFTIPADSSFAKLAGTITVWIEDGNGKTIAKNFSNIKVTGGTDTKAADKIADNSYALRQSTSASNTISNGVGAITYNYTVPDDFNIANLKNLRVLAEMSSIKAGDTQTAVGEEKPSDVMVSINGHEVSGVYIPDAPRDMRGTLALNSGADSAGEFGYLVNLNIDDATIALLKSELSSNKTLSVKYEVKSTAANKNGIKMYNERNGRYAVTPMIILNPTEIYSAATDILVNGNTTVVENVGNKNFSVETDITQAAYPLSINAGGYLVEINNGKVEVKENNLTIASKNVSGDVKHIKVTYFDQEVRVYVNNNPEALIDVYGKAFANGGAVTVSSGNAKLSKFTVIPETYANTSSISSESDVQIVESFEVTNLNRWSFMNSNTSWGDGSNTGSMTVATGAQGAGVLNVDVGAGQKLINSSFNAANVIVEGDFVLNDRHNNAGRDANAGFIIRGSEYVNNVDGANGYYVGIGLNGNPANNSGFVQVGRMNNGWTELKKASAPIRRGEKVRLKVVAIGPRIRVYLNDNPVPYVDVYDATYASGSIAIRGFYYVGTIDNIVVATAPRYTADFENSTTAKSNYTTARLDEWATDGEWAITSGKLRVVGAGTAMVGSDVWSDSELSVKVNPTADAVSGLMFRGMKGKNGMNGYYALADVANSKVVLAKVQNGSVAVIKSENASITAGQETNLRVLVVNNNIKIFYGGSKAPLINVYDNTFFNGKSGLVSTAGTTLFDNFESNDKFTFQDTFQNGSLNGWKNIKGTWTVDQNVLSVTTGLDDKLVDTYATYSDFQLDFDFKVNGGTTNKYNAGVVFRANDFGAAQDALRGYVLGLNFSAPGNNEPSGLELGDIHYGWRWINTANTPLSIGQWYHLTIRCEGSRLQAFVDGNKLIDLVDYGYTHGQIAFRNFNAAASYKNVVVRDLARSATDSFNISTETTKSGIDAIIDNNERTPKTGNAILAVYDKDNVLIHQDFSDNFSLYGYETAGARFNIDKTKYAGCTYKIYAWDNMSPISEAYSGTF